MSITKTTPHEFKGKACNLGRHGPVKPGSVVWLTEDEATYVAAHSPEDFTEISADEAKKRKLVAPKVDINAQVVAPGKTADKVPTAPSAEDKAALEKYELEQAIEVLKDSSVAELKALCKERDIAFKPKDSALELATKLAPVIVAENKAAAAAGE